MDLQHYLDILKRRALIIAVVTAVVVAVVVSAGLLATPVYRAKTTIRVLLDVGVSEFSLGRDYSQRLLNTYDFVLGSDSLKKEALNRLEQQHGTEAGKGLHTVRAEVIPDSELIQVTVEHENPIIARDVVNTMATLLVEYAQNLYTGSDKSSMDIIDEQLTQVESEIDALYAQMASLMQGGAPAADLNALEKQIRFQEASYERLLSRYDLAQLKQNLRANSISIVQPAILPRSPSNALSLQDVGLALVVGLLGGMGLALLTENLDTRFRNTDQVERVTSLPVIGSVPRGVLPKRNNGKRDRTLEEAYRVLALNLHRQVQAMGIKTLLITSAVPGEGKSMVADNLAQVLAEQDRSIFLLESNLRRPTMSKRFSIENGYVGLSELLAHESTLEGAIFPTDQPSLYVISGGPIPSNPTALLASPAMEKLLSSLGDQAQLTLIDAPPMLGIADVSVLVPQVDGVLLIVNREVSRREHVREVLKQLKTIQAQVVGIVFLSRHRRTADYY